MLVAVALLEPDLVALQLDDARLQLLHERVGRDHRQGLAIFRADDLVV